MRKTLCVAALVFGVWTSGAAHACIGAAELVLADVQFADTVLVGYVRNYRVLPGNRRMRGSIFDYARFDVVVDEVLKGEAPPVVTVTWDNSTFGEPETIPAGRYLIALRSPASAVIPPLRAPSATIMPRPEGDLPTLLQAPCSQAFIFTAESEEATRIRSLLMSREAGPEAP